MTCCYCGTRAALVLKGSTRHELACAACGAPLHNMKMLPVRSAPEPRANPSQPATGGPRGGAGPRSKPKKRMPKRRPGLLSRFMSEAFDAIEDIFD